jgi:cystathionine beta-lyase family protein involved in aluminum resistance
MKDYGISGRWIDEAKAALLAVEPYWRLVEDTASVNRARVLRAFQRAQVTERDFFPTTGYGYGDLGRSRLEQVYADVFGGESALVRWQVCCGTHAISLCLAGFLKAGDTLVAASGKPYDTLHPVIEDLRDRGVHYREVDLFWQNGGEGNVEDIRGATMVLVQRSAGYTFRPGITIERLEKAITAMRRVAPQAVYFVDNCYGEFTEEREPLHVGADLIAGSLMKNPGGGIAPTGGYVAGRSSLVEKAAARLTAPGLGSAVGPSLGFLRLMFQGLFLAPGSVREALQGAVFAGRFFQELGFDVCPAWDEPRSDIIQAIKLGSPAALLAFCEAVQQASPVDSMAKPQPGAMPGYQHEVVMAAGTFVQGATLELSADAPLRPPFVVYMQGGLAREQNILACLLAAERLSVQAS